MFRLGPTALYWLPWYPAGEPDTEVGLLRYIEKSYAGNFRPTPGGIEQITDYAVAAASFDVLLVSRIEYQVRRSTARLTREVENA